jgi:hypothetical protein
MAAWPTRIRHINECRKKGMTARAVAQAAAEAVRLEQLAALDQQPPGRQSPELQSPRLQSPYKVRAGRSELVDPAPAPAAGKGKSEGKGKAGGMPPPLPGGGRVVTGTIPAEPGPASAAVAGGGGGARAQLLQLVPLFDETKQFLRKVVTVDKVRRALCRPRNCANSSLL